MFTGIVAAVGRIDSIVPQSQDPAAGVRLNVDAGGLDLADVALGDSISIQGACMTVIEKTPTHFAVDVSRESLNKTAGLDKPGPVNLEKALRAHDRLGGPRRRTGPRHAFRPHRRIVGTARDGAARDGALLCV